MVSNQSTRDVVARVLRRRAIGELGSRSGERDVEAYISVREENVRLMRGHGESHSLDLFPTRAASTDARVCFFPLLCIQVVHSLSRRRNSSPTYLVYPFNVLVHSLPSSTAHSARLLLSLSLLPPPLPFPPSRPKQSPSVCVRERERERDHADPRLTKERKGKSETEKTEPGARGRAGKGKDT